MSAYGIEIPEKDDAEFWIGFADIAENLLNMVFCFTVRIRHPCENMSGKPFYIEDIRCWHMVIRQMMDSVNDVIHIPIPQGCFSSRGRYCGSP